MGVFRTCINLQILEESVAKTSLGKHAAYGLLDNELGLLGKIVRRSSETLSAGIARVTYICLLYTSDAADE